MKYLGVFMKICSCLLALLVSFVFKLSAFDASPPCYKNLQTHFFQPLIVTEALSLYNINQGAWTPIIQNLNEASKKIPRIIQEKSNRMNPNPLSPVYLPELAEELLTNTLFEVFVDIITTYNFPQGGSVNGQNVDSMFKYLLDKQKNEWDRCFFKEKKN